MTAAVFALIVELAAQSASTITGRVIADDTGNPVANARVSIATASGFAAPVTLTDADGRFSVPRPAEAPRAGAALRVAVTKTGYTRTEAAAGERAVEIRLKRGAVISGRVVDEFGEPVENVRIVAQTDPKARLALADGVSTDDRGEYRLTGLQAGSFIVSVTRVYGTLDPRTARQREPDTIFYPGSTASAEAKPLQLVPGSDQRRIDFVFPAARPQPPALMLIRAAQNAAQPSRSGPAPTGVIRGHITDTEGGPIAHAMVQLLSQADIMQWQGMLADDRGAFEFRNVAGGAFEVLAEKSGYSAEVRRQVTLGDGSVSDPLDIRLGRRGVITGRIVDELGEPVEHVSVEVMDITFEGGRHRLGRAGQAQLTDDDGRFRVFGLRRGQYVVSAVAHGVATAELPGYARAFFPGTTSPADARIVTIGPSAQIDGVDFALSRAPTFLVAGRVLDAAGQPTTGGGLQLVPALRAAAVVGAPIGARVGTNGSFEFPNVTPGQYVVRADRGRKNRWTEGEFGIVPIVVSDADVTGLVVAMSSGSAIHGRIRFDSAAGNTSPPAPASVEITPVPVEYDLSSSNPATADVHGDGSFDVAGINGPRRIEVTRVPAGWAVDAVRAGGIDITDRPITFGRAEQSLRDVDVILTDRISELRGTVLDSAGQATAGQAVIAFTIDRTRWYDRSRFVRRTDSGSKGDFTIEGLPFGTYYVAAMPRPDGDAWRDPALLDALAARAATVVVREGQRQAVQVRLR